MAVIETRLTRRFELETPLLLAPMALAAGGALAAEWARAGGLGLLGGGYCDPDWVAREWGLGLDLLGDDAAARARLGCGFISWKLEQDSRAFDWLLDQAVRPSAVMLSFGDAGRWGQRLAQSGVPLIVQIQRMEQLDAALAAGAAVIVAQGVEAGGHGMRAALGRGTFTLVPEIADRLSAVSPETMLVGAGGVSDGRGVAALLALGADGALIGSRAWATDESLAAGWAKQAACEAGGDDTMRSSIFDILRRKDWPEPFDFRALRNGLHRQWEGREGELAADPAAAIAQYAAGMARGDPEAGHVTVGEAVGLIGDVLPAGVLVRRITQEARRDIGQLARVAIV
jgi:nitronate monooxygenase